MSEYPIDGDKRLQVSARKALPILVRQAQAGEPIYYGNLAPLLGYSNPRNLDDPLGCIGHTLHKLSEEWGEEVPQIQALVINKKTEMPGHGIDGLLGANFKRLSRTRRREAVKGVTKSITDYPHWNEVLNTFDLEKITTDFKKTNKAAARRPQGEGETHKKFKKYIAANPQLLKPTAPKSTGEIEVRLPSGDSLDVSFDSGREWIAVEVKTAASPDADITRGIYQCIKYSAVMQAVQTSEGRERDVRTVLMLEGELPESLIALKNLLGVEVIDNVELPKGRKTKTAR